MSKSRQNIQRGLLILFRSIYKRDSRKFGYTSAHARSRVRPFIFTPCYISMTRSPCGLAR